MTDAPTAREARMIEDLLRATEQVMAAYIVEASEGAVSDIVTHVYRRYGMAGLCGLTSQIIRDTIPAEVKNGVRSGLAVSPMLVDEDDDDDACGECEDCKNYACMNSVMQYMAAVMANDPDMTIALFKANVVSVKDERSQRWLSLVISTACNTFGAEVER